MNISFKSGTVLIEESCAYFKFDKFYDRLKSKNWKYNEDKTGAMMQSTYKKCEIQFLDQKRFPRKEKGKDNSPTKNVVKILESIDIERSNEDKIFKAEEQKDVAIIPIKGESNLISEKHLLARAVDAAKNSIGK